MIAELDGLQSADEAADWAHRSLPAKNALTAEDADVVEAAFRAKLAAFGDGRPADGLGEGVQDRPGGTAGLPRSSRPKKPLAPVPEMQAHVGAGGSGSENPQTGFDEPDAARRSGGIDKNLLTIGEPRRIRDKEHRKFVAAQACLVCGRQPSDAHHLRLAQPRALGRKVSDEFTVPLCRIHHREVHRRADEAAWWNGWGINPYPVAAALWSRTRGVRSVAELPNNFEATALPGSGAAR